jgi:biotin operon repressor
MGSPEETRLTEILIMHNEPVPCEDLACALRLSRAEVLELAITLQKSGYAIVDAVHDTVAATPTADAALHKPD